MARVHGLRGDGQPTRPRLVWSACFFLCFYVLFFSSVLQRRNTHCVVAACMLTSCRRARCCYAHASKCRLRFRCLNSLKFRMGAREQLRMSAKVTECARAARQMKCLNRPPVCAGIGSVLQPWGGGERQRHILLCLVALFAPIPPPPLVLPPKRRSR